MTIAQSEAFYMYPGNTAMIRTKRFWYWKLARHGAHRGRRTYCITGRVERAVQCLHELYREWRFDLWLSCLHSTRRLSV
jgi:hypothetical protein